MTEASVRVCGICEAQRCPLFLRQRRLLAAVLMVLGIATACVRDDPLEPESACEALQWDRVPRRESVILIVSDAMRRDHMGIYGGSARTPAFDGFARKNLLFTRASSQAPWTKPAIATLFTGLYPSQHRILTGPAREKAGLVQTNMLGANLTTLAEIMRSAGHQTGAVIANDWIGEHSGFAQGFDFFHDPLAVGRADGSAVNRAALSWLDQRDPDRPYFLYLHYMDSHTPYPALTELDLEQLEGSGTNDTPGLYPSDRSKLRKKLRAHDGRPLEAHGVKPSLDALRIVYRRAVENFDRALGELLVGLAARSLEPAIFVTADHGESLGEHGRIGHGFELFEGELAIPFAVRLPGVTSNGDVQCSVGLIDVMATLCVYLAAECPADDHGVSFLPVDSANPRPRRYLVSEGVQRAPYARSMRNRDYKLIFRPSSRSTYALYAIETDPEERHDLLAEPNVTPETRRLIEVWRRRLAESVGESSVPRPPLVAIGEDTRRRLEALGYLAEPPARTDQRSDAGGRRARTQQAP